MNHKSQCMCSVIWYSVKGGNVKLSKMFTANEHINLVKSLSSSYVLPETVEVKIVCIKIRKGLWSITWTMRLQHRWTGWYDCGLAWGMDGFELELWTHPQTSVGSGMRYNFYLEQTRNHDWGVSWPPSESLSSSPHLVSEHPHSPRSPSEPSGRGEGIIHNQKVVMTAACIDIHYIHLLGFVTI